jgi:alkylhydroperoxidase/carboxymuconolactone decarboxylase family protein YurZ
MSRPPTLSAETGADDCMALLRTWDPEWCTALHRLRAETGRGILSVKTETLIQLAIHATVTGMNTPQMRRYVASALTHGVTSEEVLAVFKLCTVIGIHAMAIASPILEEGWERVRQPSGGPLMEAETPTIRALRAQGKFNQAWAAIERWDALWLDRFLAVGLDPNIESVLGEETVELLYIAIDAAVTHLYCPGTRRHIDAVLRMGVSPIKVLEVLKLVSLQGIHSIEAGVRILEEECRARGGIGRT